MKARLRKHWFLAGLVVVWILGFLSPEVCKAYQKSSLVDWAIALVMLCSGLTLETSHVFEQLRNWRAVLFSFFMMYLVAPVIIFVACLPLRFSGSEANTQLFVGFVILAAQSCTLGSGIVISTAARGNVALALVVTVVNSMCSTVMTPLLLRWMLSVHIEVQTLAMIGRLAVIILLPVTLGQLIRPWIKSHWEPVRWLPSILTQLVILSLIYMSVGTSRDWIVRSPWLVAAMLAATLVLHGIILAANYALSTLATKTKASRRSLAICSSQKTLATGSYVWARFFADNPLGGIPLMFYHVVQLVFDSLLAHWWAQKDTHAAAPTLETLGAAEEKQM